MDKSLSVRIAERVTKQRASTRELNRAVFLALRHEIHQAMDDGWPVATIWRTLKEEKKITFSYQAFRGYVNKLVVKHAGASIDTPPPPRQPLPSGKTQKPAPKGKEGGFTFDPIPNLEDLV